MATKTTIYKVKVNLSDLDRNRFESLAFTVAQHPSENLERMMARVLVFCINHQDGLAFTKGLSDVDVPTLWVRTLDDRLTHWIEVGEPAADRVKKACGLSDEVMVYSFNNKSSVWWDQAQARFAALSASVYRLDWAGIQQLATLVERNMELSITITDETAFVSADSGSAEISWVQLQGEQG